MTSASLGFSFCRGVGGVNFLSQERVGGRDGLAM